jgi:hypothetical protein
MRFLRKSAQKALSRRIKLRQKQININKPIKPQIGGIYDSNLICHHMTHFRMLYRKAPKKRPSSHQILMRFFKKRPKSGLVS